MSLANYRQQTQSFQKVIDFLRFAVSEANRAKLYYGHGTTSAWDDFLSLMLHVLALEHDADNVIYHARLTENEKEQFLALVDKRINQRIPAPYLIKQAHFCGMTFYVDERVIIPRSPIAELIHDQFSPWVVPENVSSILDMCTGSGCIAIACCHAFADATVDAVDISSDALDVAKINQQTHELESQLTLFQSNVFDELPTKQYDIIVSNPPYVTTKDYDEAPAEFHHEPKLALEADQDGLQIVDRMLAQASHYLSDDGVIFIEVGNTYEQISEKYPEVPFTWLDFAGEGGVFMLTKEQLTTYF